MLYFLAIDIGASSGRHILGHKEGEKILLEEVYRFENNLIKKNGHLCWDTEALFGNILEGMKKCGEIGKIPASVAIDTWGVDFVLLDKNDEKLGEAIAYRDSRTEGIDKVCEEVMSFEELYAHTGIQKQAFNTIYQLVALKKESPELLEKAETFLMTPEYYSFLLTGKKANEYTNATTGALVNAESRDWDFEVLEKLGIPTHIFGELKTPMAEVGELKADVQKFVGYNTKVILCASHDTGSAFMAVPAKDDNAVYISSGTWSLLGIESLVPHTGPDSCRENFTNEGGFDYRYRYLKNIMGLWMIQSVRRNLDKKYSFPELMAFAKEEQGFPGRVDVNDNAFLAPENMIDAVTENASVRPENLGQVMECIYRSLAECYRDAVKSLEKLTGKTFTSVNIVGGGSQDTYLDELTSEYTGLPVYTGPIEGTALGNIMCQMIKAEVFEDLSAARAAIRKSFEIKEFRS